MKEKWWHKSIGYQIYPKSYQDTNGDGIGDIEGIRKHLSDLKELGIDIVWISPVNVSPMIDHGYDIADYYRIDPEYGTEEEMKSLIKEADNMGIKILMDLVINHTSDKHEWFQKALEDPEGKFADYYIIRDGIESKPPNNWRSMFGGSAWERIPGTEKYYLHLFTKNQPDLNWENRELRNELYEIIRYWMKQGIAGFRVDAIAHIKKNHIEKYVTPDGPDGLANAWDCYRNAEGIEQFLREMRDEAFLPNECVTIAEIDVPKADMWEEYLGDEGYFSTIFDFSHTPYSVHQNPYQEDYLDLIEMLKRRMYNRYKEAKGKVYFVTFLENHDLPRALGRLIPKQFHSDMTKKLLGISYFFLNGMPVIYQGQEIGMDDYPKEDIHEYVDLATHNRYEELKYEGKSAGEALDVINKECRENSRTPMQWDDSEYAGFSAGRPWFPVNPNYTKCNYKAQLKDDNSILNFYKRMIQIRKREDLQDLLAYGELKAVCSDVRGCVGYIREMDEKSVGVLTNYTPDNMELYLSFEIGKILLSNHETVRYERGRMILAPFQGIIFEL